MSVQCKDADGSTSKDREIHASSVRRRSGIVARGGRVRGHDRIRLDSADVQGGTTQAQEALTPRTRQLIPLLSTWDVFCGVWWCVATEIAMQRVEAQS